MFNLILEYAAKLDPDQAALYQPRQALPARWLSSLRRGLEPFEPVAQPHHLADRGYDSTWGGGSRIGYFGQFAPALSVGVAWIATPTQHERELGDHGGVRASFKKPMSGPATNSYYNVRGT